MVTALTNLVDRALAPLALVQRAPPLRHANAAFLALAGPLPWVGLEAAIARLFDGGAPVETGVGEDGQPGVLFSLWPLHDTGSGGPAAALIVAFPSASPEPGFPAKAVHDLRGSLNNIGLSVELLLRAPLSPADRAARLHELRELVDIAGKLLERFPSRPAHRSETV
jgi:hypothetical protein